MVELSPTVIFFAILLSVPIQFYLSPRSSSDAKYYVYRFVDQIKRVYNTFISEAEHYSARSSENTGNGELSSIIDEFGDDTVDENVLKEDKPSISDLLEDLINLEIHAIQQSNIGWVSMDETAKAPEWWVRKAHKDRKDLLDLPNYTVLIDTRDRLHPQMGYVAEENVVLSSGAVVHPLVKHYFESFDGKCYKSRPWHQKVYPND
uniref:Hemimethylated DNA-binding domain-containing protein n=1 Tax=Ditylenchus dipsaci TaxID=166011 RepID=A0A915CPF4_9BILA